MQKHTTIHRKKRKKIRRRYLGWAVLVLFFSIAIFGIKDKMVQDIMAEDIEETIKVKDTTVSSEIYPGLNLTTSTKDLDLYTLSISHPTTEVEWMNEQINNWVEDQEKEFALTLEENQEILKENDFSGHLNIQTKTEKLADKIYSLELEAYELAGGASGSVKYKTFIVDLNTQEMLTASDIFNLEEEAIEETKELLRENLYEDEETSDYVFDDLFEEKIATTDHWRVTMTPEQANFYFDQYEVGAAAAGAIKVSIPMEEIQYYLNKEFTERIGLEVPEIEVPLDPEGKYVALTFDDGPHAEVTPRVLEVLADYDAKATFYMLGSQVEYYPEIAKRVEEEGHEIGDHTMSHKDLSRLGSAQVAEEIDRSTAFIEGATATSPKSLRPPYGALNDEVKRLSGERSLPIIMWSVDSLDWQSRNATAIYNEVMANVTPGGIVLLHDIHSTTADALPQILAQLKEQGYEMITVSELLELGEYEGVGPYHSVDY